MLRDSSISRGKLKCYIFKTTEAQRGIRRKKKREKINAFKLTREFGEKKTENK